MHEELDAEDVLAVRVGGDALILAAVPELRLVHGQLGEDAAPGYAPRAAPTGPRACGPASYQRRILDEVPGIEAIL